MSEFHRHVIVINLMAGFHAWNQCNFLVLSSVSLTPIHHGNQTLNSFLYWVINEASEFLLGSSLILSKYAFYMMIIRYWLVLLIGRKMIWCEMYTGMGSLIYFCIVEEFVMGLLEFLVPLLLQTSFKIRITY